MKKLTYSLMVAVFAISMVLGVGTANASWTTGHSLVTVLVTGQSSVLAAVKGGTADPIYTTVAGESLAANDTIRIDLVGGAVWAAVPTLTPSAGDIGAGAATVSVPLSGGTVGSSYALWRVIAAVPTGSTLTLNSFSAADFDVRPLAVGSNVDMTMTLTTSTGLLIGTVKSHKAVIGNYLFTGAAAETIALTAVTDTADVSATTGAYTKFLGATVTGTASTLSFTNASGAATVPASATNSAAKVLFTLAGDFTGIASISAAGCTGSDATGSQTGGTAGFFLINSAKTLAYASNTAAVAAAGLLAVAPVFTIDGTAQQTARAFTASVSVLADTGKWAAHVPQAAVTLQTIARNGWEGTVPYMWADIASQDTFIKIFNNSSIAAPVTVAVTSDDGTKTGTVTLASIPAKSVGIYWANAIATSAGLTIPGAFGAVFTLNAPSNLITAVANQKRPGSVDRVLPVYHDGTGYKSY